MDTQAQSIQEVVANSVSLFNASEITRLKTAMNMRATFQRWNENETKKKPYLFMRPKLWDSQNRQCHNSIRIEYCIKWKLNALVGVRRDSSLIHRQFVLKIALVVAATFYLSSWFSYTLCWYKKSTSHHQSEETNESILLATHMLVTQFNVFAVMRFFFLQFSIHVRGIHLHDFISLYDQTIQYIFTSIFDLYVLVNP